MVGVVQKYPALTFLSALGPVLVAVIGFFVNDGHLTVTQGAWVTTVVVGLVSLYTAFRTDNLSISLLTGFATGADAPGAVCATADAASNNKAGITQIFFILSSWGEEKNNASEANYASRTPHTEFLKQLNF